MKYASIVKWLLFSSWRQLKAEGSSGKILAEQKKLHFHGAPKKNCRLMIAAFNVTFCSLMWHERIIDHLTCVNVYHCNANRWSWICMTQSNPPKQNCRARHSRRILLIVCRNSQRQVQSLAPFSQKQALVLYSHCMFPNSEQSIISDTLLVPLWWQLSVPGVNASKIILSIE